MKISGIYIIQNILNEKLYVGSSVNINSRLSQHKYQLKKKIHSNVVVEIFLFTQFMKCSPQFELF